MTYFSYLALFVFLPILILMGVLRWQKQPHPPQFSAFNPWLVLATLILVAVTYTTPWDNYLVATNVWWYDPALVTGIVIGWVPIEEYTFFVVQPILTGLWLFFLMRNWGEMTEKAFEIRPKIRNLSIALLSIIWLISTILLISGYGPTTYLSLELSWALIPIGIQIAYGADILWHYRKLVTLTIVPSTLYLAATDAVAIAAGTWTIDPAQSTGILLGGVLPIEEFIFFFITNILVVFGITLILSAYSRARFDAYVNRKRAITT